MGATYDTNSTPEKRKADMCSEYSRLRAENERLRAELAELVEARQRWRSRMGLKVESDIVQENERLRSLAGTAIWFADHGDYSTGNTHGGIDEGEVLAAPWFSMFREVAAELGVVVDSIMVPKKEEARKLLGKE